jgi:hypothetical protein
MKPLPDRVVMISLLATIGLCFALVLWSVKLQPRPEAPLEWRDGETAGRMIVHGASLPLALRQAPL